jgi:hypothetical protein
MDNFEVFIITYTEANGESNHRFLRRLYNKTLRVDNVKGIAQAYKKVLEDTTADYVYIVEGDHNVKEDFRFKNIEDDNVHVWPSINRCNQMLTHSSGIKCFPVKHYKNHNFNSVDVLLDIPTGIVWEDIPASYNQYDNTDFHTFSHVVKQNLKLRMMMDAKLPHAQDEYNKWQEWDLNVPYRQPLIKGSWAYAESLDHNNLPENFFNDYDELKKAFVQIAVNQPEGNNEQDTNPWVG